MSQIPGLDTNQGQGSKTSSEIVPTPPSPTHSSPSLTQSTSNSSASPPHPSTPPPRYHRSRTRYPTDLGRVPLHRRGTSHTYEPFEDLLREAGYKETRIYTPEAERIADVSGKNASPADQEAKGGVSRVVGFLTGLMPGAGLKRTSSFRDALHSSEDMHMPTDIVTSTIQEYSPPPSPVSQRQRQKQNARPSTPRRSISSADDSGPTPKAKTTQTSSRPSAVNLHSHSTHQASQNDLPYAHHSNGSYTSLNSQHRYHASQQASNARLTWQYTTHSPSQSPLPMSPRALPGSVGVPPSSPLPYEPRQITHTIYHPRPSRASAYLRHMASAPNMPRRPSSTPAHQSLLHAQQRQLSRSKSSRGSSKDDLDELYENVRGNGEGEEDPALPPMPRTWLETVARAVLFGGAGAYVGGPSISSSTSNHQRSASNPHSRPVRTSSTARQTPALRQTRSIVSRVQSQDSKAVSLERSSKYRGSSAHAHLHRTRSGLSDQTNRGHLFITGPYSRSATTTPLSSSSRLSPLRLDTRLPARPELLLRVVRGRSEASESEVRKTRVVCRSAPTSRAGSVTRGGSVEGRDARRNGSFAHADASSLKLLRGRGRKSSKGTDRSPVPTLARTRAEGDDDQWFGPGSGRKGKRRIRKRQHYRSEEENRFSGRAWSPEGDGGSESGSDHSPSNSEEEEEEEEEEGELDLAKMLVPPKRQKSIRSLRKHLVGSKNTTPSNDITTAVVGASGVASSSLMRRGSSHSSKFFNSGNSRRYRHWLSSDTMAERWEDEVEGEAEAGVADFMDGRGNKSRRLSTGNDEFVVRLDNSNASRQSTRLGIPSGWTS